MACLCVGSVCVVLLIGSGLMCDGEVDPVPIKIDGQARSVLDFFEVLIKVLLCQASGGTDCFWVVQDVLDIVLLCPR